MHALRNRPLRVKLSLLIVILLAMGLFVSSVLATAALRGYLVDRVDEQLAEAAHPFAAFPDRLMPLGAQAQGESRPRPPSRFYIEIVTADGATVVEEPTTGQDTVPAIPDPSTFAAIEGSPMTVASVDSSDAWRILVTPLSGQSGWAVMAYPMGDVRATVGRLVLLQSVVGVAVTVIAGVAGFVVVRRSLRPLDEMAATAHEIADGDLTLRVAETATSSEVKELAASFNTMVTRIEGSFAAQQASETQARQSEERMRRFVADAGHELRTPLTSIRGYAELIEQGAAPDPGEAVARIQLEAQRMGGLVDDLQLLARLDEQRPMDREPVDLAAVAADAVDAAQVAEPDRAITLTLEGTRPVVAGDARRLRQVLDNLLSNAVRYSPPGSAVAVTVAADADAADARLVRVAVTDKGQGLSAEDAARVFDRLYRTDEARSRVHGGSGLGLAIVQSIVDAHGGDVYVESELGSGSTFGFTIPLGTQPVA